ncbi:type VII secretion-associated serine protease mycosin [Streptomyces lincolnensis]|uniref:type VII secretion-associated serine protease mycosin n=1 Tax=Streptomyces lincolnensis TaxID=1915 RepID=UPI001E506E1D|nr:type VII secretion-associated serine protease mycosin [Streptomyces lincolnensis]MCD7440423.1 type VII secretion-associated serine protease mycosin [Streptomyces lincolnensis]
MRTSSTRYGGRRAAAAAALGLLLVGSGTPAQASTREEQWFLDAMKAEQMWKTSTGEGITVAVVDSGVDPDNPDLKGRVLSGKNFAPDQPGDEHTDYDGHGTGMAGLIAGTGAYGGGQGAFGLAPGVKILPIRMPDSDSSANQAEADKQFDKVAPEAIRYAADAGAQVINISLGHTTGSPQLTDAVKYALTKGSLIFAAVGNSGTTTNQVEYPAATPGVVGVAAVGRDLRRTAESEYGPQVDMAAPGEDMLHACGSKTGLCESHGTSDATALASASAALIWSKHPTWTNNQVLRVMLNTIGAPTDGKKRNDAIGYGIVRPRIALQNPGDPGPADVYPLPDLKADSSRVPTPATSANERSDGTETAGSQESPDATVSSSKDGSSTLWIALGSGGIALAGGTIALLVRSRRRPSSAPLPPATSGQFGYPGPGFIPPPDPPGGGYPPRQGPGAG